MNMSTVKDVLRRYGGPILVALGILASYRACQSYQHFEWQSWIVTEKATGLSHEIAIPSWRK